MKKSISSMSVRGRDDIKQQLASLRRNWLEEWVLKHE